MLITPTGRLLPRCSHDGDGLALFAAQFSLSHAWWLITYPLAGWLGARVGFPLLMVIHAAITMAAVGLAAWLPDLSPIIRLAAHQTQGSKKRHSRIYLIDDLHRHWPIESSG
jgi:hypothetical protein